MTKITKIVLTLLFIILSVATLFLGYRYYQASKRSATSEIQKIKLEGIIKKGSEISPQKDYCKEELYLVTDSKTYQLRPPDGVKEKAIVLYSQYRNAKVKIDAIYQDLLPNCNQNKKDCGCDQFILVKSIKETKAANLQEFTTFKGKIACLPLKDGSQITEETCALGFITNDGKNYILKNSPESALVVNNEIEIVGEIEKEKVESLYIVDGLINVIKIK